MKITPKEYGKLTDKASPPSKSFQNMLYAFLVGGAICTIGEVIFQCYTNAGLVELDARAATSITLIGLSALFTALNLYDSLAKYAGAGTLVPITGFANAVVSPAMEFKSEGHVLGIGAKIFSIAGPVILFGVSASAIYGLILWIFRAII